VDVCARAQHRRHDVLHEPRDQSPISPGDDDADDVDSAGGTWRAYERSGLLPIATGCQGDFSSIGTAQGDRIEATFNGSDYVLSAEPVLFIGSVSLTKVR
jgi:hypothetical protein